jgi:hypothetical protein
MKPIILNSNYRVEKDSYSWVLIFNETRQKKNKETGLKEDYVFEDKWYYPDFKMLLKRWYELECKDCESVKELSQKLDFISCTIDELKNTIFR